METTKNNQEEVKAKEELLNKRVVLSDEQLQEATGGIDRLVFDYCSQYFEGCKATGGSREDCAQKCGY